MKSSLLTLVLALFVCVAAAASSFSCDTEKKIGHKVRYEWRALSSDDQQLFIDALLALKNTTIVDPRNSKLTMSKYDMIVREHNDLAAWPHFTSLFFPWHRRYLLFFEDALRALGGKYSCVTLPFWDWTKDSNNELSSPLFFDSAFGGDGNRAGRGNKQWCVTQGPFKNFGSPNPYSYGCLKRQFNSSTHFVAPGRLWEIISERKFFDTPVGDTPRGFWMNFESKPHANPHIFVGGDNGDMSVMWSPSDPLFWLHHTMVDLVWTVWMDCHDHDKVAIADITKDIYYPLILGSKPKVDVSLDAALPYGSLKDLTSDKTPITARRMHNITSWGYAYDRAADLVTKADMKSSSVCSFQSFDVTTKASRDVSDMSNNDNMELANSIWNDLKQVKSIQSDKARLSLLSLAECQIQKANADAFVYSANYTRWLEMMGGLELAPAFAPLC